MQSLDALQASISHSVITGDSSAVAPVLWSRGEPTRRLAIHSRHYTASLIGALIDRFPAIIWLVGSERVVDAARAFVREHPPSAPCIAEYGERFPSFLAERIPQLPYVAQFGTLEWHVGRLSLAIEDPPLTDLSNRDPVSLSAHTFTLQPSVAHLRLDWPLDELLSFYMRDSAPDDYRLLDQVIWLEVRGVRGELQLNRLTPGAFAFRDALAKGVALGDAVLAGLDAEATFNPIHEFLALIKTGLLVGDLVEGRRP